MSGDALGWYQWMHHNNLFTTWDEFVRALEIRFGPLAFENHQQALFKLQQTSTVAAYQWDFERLCNRVNGLPAPAILDCFISGLRSDIQNEMAILQRTSIAQAIGLAKLVETKLQATKPLHYFNPRLFPPKPPQIAPIPNSNPTPTPKPPLLPTPPARLTLPAPMNLRPNLPIKYLSPAEMDARRAKGLCFNCDERFHKGHRCKHCQFLLLLTSDDPSDPTNPTEDFYYLDYTEPPLPTSLLHTKPESYTEPTQPETYPNPPENFHLSLHALTGQPAPTTLRFSASIHGHIVSVLVDTGSFHNILQPRLATFLHLLTQTIESFSVMVGNGAYLECSGMCPDVPLVVLKHTFHTPFYLLSIQGADVVLGV